jgi:hypothetical protein
MPASHPPSIENPLKKTAGVETFPCSPGIFFIHICIQCLCHFSPLSPGIFMVLSCSLSRTELLYTHTHTHTHTQTVHFSISPVQGPPSEKQPTSSLYSLDAPRIAPSLLLSSILPFPTSLFCSFPLLFPLCQYLV